MVNARDSCISSRLFYSVHEEEADPLLNIQGHNSVPSLVHTSRLQACVSCTFSLFCIWVWLSVHRRIWDAHLLPWPTAHSCSCCAFGVFHTLPAVCSSPKLRPPEAPHDALSTNNCVVSHNISLPQTSFSRAGTLLCRVLSATLPLKTTSLSISIRLCSTRRPTAALQSALLLCFSLLSKSLLFSTGRLTKASVDKERQRVEKDGHQDVLLAG